MSFSLRPFLDLSKKEKVVVLSAQCGDTAVGFFFLQAVAMGLRQLKMVRLSWIACVVFSKHKINLVLLLFGINIQSHSANSGHRV